MKHFPAYFTNKAILTYAILLAICSIFFPNPLSSTWIIFGLVACISFFYFSSKLSLQWQKTPEKEFLKRIFLTAVTIRILYVIFIYFFYSIQFGEPFEYMAADSKGYHHLALWWKDLISSGQFSYYWENKRNPGISDEGWPAVLYAIYSIFGNGLIIPRIINAFISAWMLVFIYKIAKRNFNEQTAKIAAVFGLVLPNFIYYTGLHLKETLMIFLAVAFIERADLMLRKRVFRIKELLVVGLLGSSLFFFRTVLGAAAVFSLITALIFTGSNIINKSKRIIAIFWIFILGVIIAGSVISEEIMETYIDSKTNQERSMLQRSERTNELAKYGSRAIFLPVILVAPFPTLVETNQYNALLLNGAMFTRNVFVFFVFIALFVLLKKKLWRNHVMLLTFLGSYLFILASSGFAISERFHLPVLPFLIILSAFGVTQLKNSHKQYYLIYLVIIGFIILGWNWFKLAGRGMI